MEARFYKLPDSWHSLAVTSRDLNLLGQLKKQGHLIREANLFSLVTAYAKHNADGVRELERANDEVSSTLLSDVPTTALGARTFSANASRSLFAIKYSCAMQPTAADAIEGTLRRIFPKRSWVLAHLTYPLVYRFVAQPSPEGLEQFLAYLFPLAQQATERVAILHLLHDDAIDRSNMAFQIYVMMMAHPYDACQLLLSHIERDMAQGELNGTRRDFLQFAADELGSRRAADLLAIATQPTSTSRNLSGDAIATRFDLSSSDADKISGILSADPSTSHTTEDSPIAVLCRMREALYPIKVDFTRVTAVQNNWSFTDGGRQIMAILRSLYMVDRTDPSIERTAFLRLLAAARHVSHYMIAGPSALSAARSLEAAGCTFDPHVDCIEGQADETILGLKGQDDRSWIHVLQWKLRKLQEQARIRSWVETIRAEAEYKTSFLTGIDWSFAEEVIEANLLDDFVTFDGAYALLLMESERPSDLTRLDTVLEILLEGLDAHGAVDRLIEEYGETAPIFVRRFLTPANLRFNRMADDHLSALDERVKALEECLRRTGFGQLSEEAYRSETKTLTSELLLANLNTGKFEIPWATFRRDSRDRFEDLHEVYTSLMGALRDNKALSELAYSPAQFPNGRKEDYRVKAVDTPLFQIVMGLIADFFEHNAFGLEVILSGRFRHKNLQQELWAALPGSRRVRFHGIPTSVQDEIVSTYRPVLERTLDDWADARLQTKRKERPDGLFDLVPTQTDLDELLERARKIRSLDEIIEIVVEWLRERLREQVRNAGEIFVSEVSELLAAAFAEVRERGAYPAEATEDEKRQIHQAICEEAQRKLQDLKEWFGGVDAVGSESVNLYDLATATAYLLGSVSGTTQLKVRVSTAAFRAKFDPGNLKIAFDMVREILFNALRHGRTEDVTVSIRKLHASNESAVFVFSNRTCDAVLKEERETYTEKAYEGVLAAIATEGNSGRRKIAASCSTIMEKETEVLAIRRTSFHHLVMELPEFEIA